MTHEQAAKRQLAASLFNNTDRYADIMRRPHHQSHQHRQMTNHERAAQFAPFAALTGYNDLIADSGAALVAQSYLPFEAAQRLQKQVERVAASVTTKPRVTLTTFDPATGESQTVAVRVRAVNRATRRLVLTDGREIALDTLQKLTVLPQD